MKSFLLSLIKVNYHRLVINFSWQLLEKCVRMIVGLVVGTLTIRYLGVTQFGLLAYILSITSIFQALISVGADGVAVRLIARKKELSNQILGTLFRIRIFSGFACFLGSLVSIVFIGDINDTENLLLGLLIASGMLFQAADVINIWFQSQMQGKYIFIVKASSYLIICSAKICFILWNFSIYAFAATYSIEAFLSAALFIIYYRFYRTEKAWSWNLRYANILLRQGIPVMAAAFLLVFYAQIDRIMLAKLSSVYEVGLFSSALTLTTYLNFLPLLLCISLAPLLAKAKNKVQQILLYSSLLRTIIWPSLFFTLVLFIFSDFLILMLYGDAYTESAGSLRVLSLTIPLIGIGVVGEYFALNTSRTYLIFIKSIFSLFFSITLNFLILPTLGAVGASYVMLITSIVNLVIVCLLLPNFFGALMVSLSLTRLFRILVSIKY